MSHGKRGNPTPAMSPLSAALLLHAWTLEHGRPPRAGECTGTNGLPHHKTVYRVFDAHNFSASIMPLVSALVSSVRMRQCLGFTQLGTPCGKTFPDEGAHVRMCGTCRRRWAVDGDAMDYSITTSVQRVSLREAGAGRGGWEEYETWVRDVDWSGE